MRVVPPSATIEQSNLTRHQRGAHAAMLDQPLTSKMIAQKDGPAPGLGEHTDAVLHEIGYSDAKIADLHAREVI
jgi:crotonobetainyl-CoA:carnitine CoA-transferase CaiB-like acyl-CoA transferase